MPNPSPRHMDMNCPRCKSTNTQSVPLAFSQSFRIGETGHTTNSQFGQRLAPPASRDEHFIPGLVATAAAGASMFLMPDLLDRLDIAAFQGLSSFSWQTIALSFVLAWVVGLAVAAPAVLYNLTTLRELTKEWEKKGVCRRCGHIFQFRSESDDDQLQEQDLCD